MRISDWSSDVCSSDLALRELEVDAVKVEFGIVANGQMSRAERRNLPRQLRADGAAGAGHQHAATLDQALHGRAIERRLRPSEQILDGDGANLQELIEAAAEIGRSESGR